MNVQDTRLGHHQAAQDQEATQEAQAHEAHLADIHHDAPTDQPHPPAQHVLRLVVHKLAHQASALAHHAHLQAKSPSLTEVHVLEVPAHAPQDLETKDRKEQDLK